MKYGGTSGKVGDECNNLPLPSRLAGQALLKNEGKQVSRTVKTPYNGLTEWIIRAELQGYMFKQDIQLFPQ